MWFVNHIYVVIVVTYPYIYITEQSNRDEIENRSKLTSHIKEKTETRLNSLKSVIEEELHSNREEFRVFFVVEIKYSSFFKNNCCLNIFSNCKFLILFSQLKKG